MAKIIEGINNYYGITTLDLTKLDESVNEKFTQESDPIQDMGIGIERLMKEWFEKKIGYMPKNNYDALAICANSFF